MVDISCEYKKCGIENFTEICEHCPGAPAYCRQHIKPSAHDCREMGSSTYFYSDNLTDTESNTDGSKISSPDRIRENKGKKNVKSDLELIVA